MLNEFGLLQEKIQVDTLMIFKGKKFKIVNEIDFNLSYLDILQAFEANKFLNLPKLFNKQIFLDLCTSWTESDLKYVKIISFFF